MTDTLTMQAEQGHRTNRQVVRAMVIPLRKQEQEDRDGKSKQLVEDPWEVLTQSGRIIAPPFDPLMLTMLEELNTELTPAVESMETNIDGFGYRLVPRVDVTEAPKELVGAAAKERVALTNFFLYANLDDSFTELRKKRRHDLELTGNAYWEVIRNVKDDIQGFEHMESYQVRLGTLQQEHVKIEVPILWQETDGKVRIKEVRTWKRFRTFVQIKEGKQRWFKEWGDPRVYNNETGEVVPNEKLANWRNGEPMPEEARANEVVHWRRYSGRSAYGLPRYLGALLSMYGDRSAEEINYRTFRANNVPSMIIAVSNGQLTQGSVDRITEFVENQVAESNNMSRFLILETESGEEEGEDQGQVKMDVTPLTNVQHTDALYEKYSAANQRKVRRSFRLPPIFVGGSEDYTRATADTSRKLADEQVFAPERLSFDEWVNRKLFPAMKIVFHKFRSNSPNTTDNTELTRILAGAEKTGGMSPRIARMILEDILSEDLPPLSENLDPDIPFSLTMAEAVKNQGDPTEPGQTVTALKSLQLIEQLTGATDEDVGELADLDEGELVGKLMDLRRRLEAEWRTEVFKEEKE